MYRRTQGINAGLRGTGDKDGLAQGTGSTQCGKTITMAENTEGQEVVI